MLNIVGPRKFTVRTSDGSTFNVTAEAIRVGPTVTFFHSDQLTEFGDSILTIPLQHVVWIKRDGMLELAWEDGIRRDPDDVHRS